MGAGQDCPHASDSPSSGPRRQGGDDEPASQRRGLALTALLELGAKDVEDGVSAVDMSVLTGESVPVEVQPGSEIAGATVNAGGRLVVRATKVGGDTALAQIARLVEDAQTGKAPVQRVAGAHAAARTAYARAIALSDNAVERDELRRRRDALP